MSVEIPDNLGDWNQRTNSAQWEPNTTIELFNVPWTSDYRDVVDFPASNGLNTYLNGRATLRHTIDRMVQLRPMEPIRLNIPYNALMRFNYIRVTAPAQPVEWGSAASGTAGDVSRDYYYFINDFVYVAPNTTQLNIQIDMWSTFRNDWTPGYGFVEQGHVGISNTNRMSNQGRIRLTVPEGLDTGNEYNVHSTRRETIATRQNFGILVWSTVDLIQSGGTVDNPELRTARGSEFNAVPNGATSYYFPTADDWRTWLLQNQDTPWITQGIISVQAIPDITRYNMPGVEGGFQEMSSGRPQSITHQLYPKWRDQVRETLPARYRHLDKFYTFPYCVLEMTTNTGTPLALKPEQWDINCQVREFGYFAQPSPRIVFVPLYYNRGTSAHSMDGLPDGGEWLDMSTGIYDLPTFSVVNNGYQSFMASNRNSIQYMNQSADWSQQKAIRGSESSFANALRGINDQNNQHAIQQQLANSALGIQNDMGVGRAVLGGVSGMAGGMLMGPMGLGAGLMNAATQAGGEVMNHTERNRMHAVNQNAANRSNQSSGHASRAIADSNYDLAKFAAKGDYKDQIAGIEAKVQDAKMTQPTTSGQVGGEAFNLAADEWAVDLKVKFIERGAMRRIGEFWLRFGYAVNARMRPTSFRVMSKFSYWKFLEFYITSSTLPELYKNGIRGIFEKGVTVWSNPNDIGNTDNADNNMITGDYY